MNTNLIPQTLVVEPVVHVPQSNQEELRDLVAHYPGGLTNTGWLKRLHLTEPRENLRCLPKATILAKRIFDIVAAITLIVLTLPLTVLAGILVRLTSPGPMIYSQTRVGLNLRSKAKKERRQSRRAVNEDRRNSADRRVTHSYGREFTIYKFRTMRNDAEKKGAQLAKAGDPRITAIGRFLRRTRIDELPQLWNVLKGDMSLVGPRPERPEFMSQLSDDVPNYLDRLGLKPGLTGLAQVVNGYDTDTESFRRKVMYDLLYLQNCCIANDLRILLRTVRVVITGEGAL